MIKWSKVLEENKEKIIEKMTKAKRESFENKYQFTMKEVVEVYTDGSVTSQMMSQNSQTMDSFNNKSYTVWSYEYVGVETSSDEEIEYFKNLGLIPEKLLKENDSCEIFDYIQNLDNYNVLLSELEEDMINTSIEYNTAEEDFYEALSRLKELEKEREREDS